MVNAAAAAEVQSWLFPQTTSEKNHLPGTYHQLEECFEGRLILWRVWWMVCKARVVLPVAEDKLDTGCNAALVTPESTFMSTYTSKVGTFVRYSCWDADPIIISTRELRDHGLLGEASSAPLQ